MNETEDDLFDGIEEELDTVYYKQYPSDWLNANKAFEFTLIKGGKTDEKL